MIANKKMLMAAGLLGFSAHFLVGCGEDEETTTAAGGSTGGACYGDAEVTKGEACWNCIVDSANGAEKTFKSAKIECQLIGGRFPCQGQSDQPDNTGTDLCALCFTAEGGLADGADAAAKAAAFDTCGGNSPVSGAKCGNFEEIDAYDFKFDEDETYTSPTYKRFGYCMDCVEAVADDNRGTASERSWTNIKDAIETCGSQVKVSSCAGVDDSSTTNQCDFCIADVAAADESGNADEITESRKLRYQTLNEQCGWKVCYSQAGVPTGASLCEQCATVAGWVSEKADDAAGWQDALDLCGYAPCYGLSVATSEETKGSDNECTACQTAQKTTSNTFDEVFELCGGTVTGASSEICDSNGGDFATHTPTPSGCNACLADDEAGIDNLIFNDHSGLIEDNTDNTAPVVVGIPDDCFDDSGCSALRLKDYDDKADAVGAATSQCKVCIAANMQNAGVTVQDWEAAIEACGGDHVNIKPDCRIAGAANTLDCQVCLDYTGDVSANADTGILEDGNNDAIVSSAEFDQCVEDGDFTTPCDHVVATDYANIAALHAAAADPTDDPALDCQLCFSNEMANGKNLYFRDDILAAYKVCDSASDINLAAATGSCADTPDMSATGECHQCLVGGAVDQQGAAYVFDANSGVFAAGFSGTVAHDTCGIPDATGVPCEPAFNSESTSLTIQEAHDFINDETLTGNGLTVCQLCFIKQLGLAGGDAADAIHQQTALNACTGISLTIS